MSKGLCLYSFECLYSQLNKSQPVSFNNILASVKESIDDFPQKAPLFVTWDKDHDLRGCIGTFQDQPIESGVKRFAITAALQDHRFLPIKANELPQLSCDVTLLDNFQPITDPLDWEIGKHGLRLNFEINGNYYSGTFLPVVAAEQKWDKLTTLWHLIRKSDYNVSKSETLKFYESGLEKGTLELETYEGLKYGIDYDEYVAWKNGS